MPPIRVFKGRREQAIYREQQVPAYVGNPLIEALPEIWSDEEVGVLLDKNNPSYSSAERLVDAHVRFHLLETALLQFFVTLPAHLDLQRRMSTLIRKGYLARNPASWGWWPGMEERIGELGTSIQPRRVRSTATGFTMLGTSGVGKSYGLEAVLDLYPQVIDHNCYNERDLTVTQLVWMKLECPHDGSIKGLCLNFFQAVDDVLGTSFYEKYRGYGRASVDEILPLMARVASLHCLGVLVIDEIQHLSEAKSQGSERMLNFFVQLVNTIGLPVVLVGTSKAAKVLGGQLRQIRRGCGQGDFVWDRFQDEAADWMFFAESLWGYQYTRVDCPFTTDLAHVLYEECQGIADFAVKVYMLAQARAIATGKEMITEAIIRSVARDSLRQAQDVLSLLRQGDKRALVRYEDVLPIDVGPLLEAERNKVTQRRRTGFNRSNNLVEDVVHRLTALLDVEESKARKSAQQAIKSNAKETDIAVLCRAALRIADEIGDDVQEEAVVHGSDSSTHVDQVETPQGRKRTKSKPTTDEPITPIKSVAADLKGEEDD